VDRASIRLVILARWVSLVDCNPAMLLVHQHLPRPELSLDLHLHLHPHHNSTHKVAVSHPVLLAHQHDKVRALISSHLRTR